MKNKMLIITSSIIIGIGILISILAIAFIGFRSFGSGNRSNFPNRSMAMMYDDENEEQYDNYEDDNEYYNNNNYMDDDFHGMNRIHNNMMGRRNRMHNNRRGRMHNNMMYGRGNRMHSNWMRSGGC